MSQESVFNPTNIYDSAIASRLLARSAMPPGRQSFDSDDMTDEIASVGHTDGGCDCLHLDTDFGVISSISGVVQFYAYSDGIDPTTSSILCCGACVNRPSPEQLSPNACGQALDMPAVSCT